MISLWQFKRFEARISLFKSLNCPLALAALGRNQRFTRYPPVINHHLVWCNYQIALKKFSMPPVLKVSLLRYRILIQKSWPYYKVCPHINALIIKPPAPHLDWICKLPASLQWSHNEHNSVSNHQPTDCLLNCLFRPRSKKTSKFRVTGLSAGNSPLTGEFPAQMASNAGKVSTWWSYHAVSKYASIFIHFLFTRNTTFDWICRLPAKLATPGNTFY